MHLKTNKQKLIDKWINDKINGSLWNLQILFVDLETMLWPAEERIVFYFLKIENNATLKEGSRKMREGVNEYILVFKGCRLLFFKYMEFVYGQVVLTT